MFPTAGVTEPHHSSLALRIGGGLSVSRRLSIVAEVCVGVPLPAVPFVAAPLP